MSRARAGAGGVQRGHDVSDLRGQVLALDLLALAAHRGELQGVDQLADVSGPAVGHKQVHGLVGDRCYRLVGVLADVLEQLLDQKRDVLAALAQGRQVYGHHRQPVEEVLAELVLLDHLAQVAVGGADHPHVHRDGLFAADQLEGLLLQHPQQLDLEGRAELAHLVEEQRAAVGQLETALLVADGPGERSAHVPEKLGFQDGLRQGPAVDRHEGPGLAPALVVDGPRHQLLAGPALAGDHHRVVGGGHLADGLEDVLHGRRHAHHPVKAVLLLHLEAQLGVLGDVPQGGDDALGLALLDLDGRRGHAQAPVLAVLGGESHLVLLALVGIGVAHVQGTLGTAQPVGQEHLVAVGSQDLLAHVPGDTLGGLVEQVDVAVLIVEDHPVFHGVEHLLQVAALPAQGGEVAVLQKALHPRLDQRAGLPQPFEHLLPVALQVGVGNRPVNVHRIADENRPLVEGVPGSRSQAIFFGLVAGGDYHVEGGSLQVGETPGGVLFHVDADLIHHLGHLGAEFAPFNPRALHLHPPSAELLQEALGHHRAQCVLAAYAQDPEFFHNNLRKVAE